MNPKKRQDSLRFMFNESGNPKWWKPEALMKSVNPQGNPPGDLSLAEAQSIFHDLKKKELLLPFINQAGEACSLLNECKEDEWHVEIADAVKPWWRKSRVLKTAFKVTLWGLGALLGGYLGALGKNAAEKRGDPIGIKSPGAIESAANTTSPR